LLDTTTLSLTLFRSSHNPHFLLILGWSPHSFGLKNVFWASAR
jgi:hypothetical protein